MKIAIAINYVDYANPDKKNMQDIALSVLVNNRPKNSILATFNYPEDKIEVPSVFRVFPMLKMDSQKDLGNNRRMPYIKEILDLCSQLNCDVFGYMNSDILLTKDFFTVFDENHNAFVFYKRDIDYITRERFLSSDIRVVNDEPHGQDAFFFNKEWWLSHRNFFPNGLILGESEWDTCYNAILQKICPSIVVKRVLFHIYHDRVWSIDSRGSINNTLIWKEIKSKYGLPLSPEEFRGR